MKNKTKKDVATTKKDVQQKQIDKKNIINMANKKERSSNIYLHLSMSMSAKEQKKFRGKKRRTLQRYINEMIFLNVKKDKKEMQTLRKEFIKYYKDNYVINDLSVASLYLGYNEAKIEDVKEFLRLLELNK